MLLPILRGFRHETTQEMEIRNDYAPVFRERAEDGETVTMDEVEVCGGPTRTSPPLAGKKGRSDGATSGLTASSAGMTG